MKTKRLLLALLPIIALGGCQKDKNETPDLDGNYTGKFIISKQNVIISTDSIGVLLKSGDFSSDNNVGIITTGKGNFRINGQNVSFVNTVAFPDNTSVNTVAVLNGTYAYTIKGDSVFLSKTDTAKNMFIYKMKKH